MKCELEQFQSALTAAAQADDAAQMAELLLAHACEAETTMIPCSFYLDAAYQMCGWLARLYPEQAAAVAAVVTRRQGL